MAGQALTTNNSAEGRFCLGIGLSHEITMAQLGIGFDKPIRHLREYLSILMPLLDEGSVDFTGETLSCQAELFGAGRAAPSVVVAALGPQALRVAGNRTDGTTLAWVGPKTIANHIAPRICEAADRAGRSEPRIIANLPVVVTKNDSDVRRRIAADHAIYDMLPSYQAMFEREGVDGPGDLAIVGSESEVLDGIHALREAGVTDFAASILATSADESRETSDLLQRLASA